MNNPMKPILLIALLCGGALRAQVFDRTMLSHYTWGGLYPKYHEGFGTRNYVPNGNFNGYIVSSGGCAGQSWGGYWTSWLGAWSGYSSNSSTPYSMIEPGTYWPYDMRYYCDFDDSNFSHMAAQLDIFHGGYVEVDLCYLQNGIRGYNYLLVTLTKPLTPGVAYAFSMDVTKGWATNPAYSPALDRIGAVLLHELPDTLTTNGGLLDLVPFAETTQGDPLSVIDVVDLQDTVIGSGEKYLVIGIFRPDSAITFDPPVPSPIGWTSEYWFDNLKLYRAFCGNANSELGPAVVHACVGDSITLTPQFTTTSIQWAVNGISAGSDPSIDVVMPYLDTLLVQLVGDTGVCQDTGYAELMAYHTFLNQADTFLFCSDPMIVDPVETYTGLFEQQVAMDWYSVDSSSVGTWIQWLPTNLPGPGTYVVRSQYSDCVQIDTLNVGPAQPLATNGGTPWLLPEIRPEHCVNMDDGSIIVHNTGYPGAVTYDWYDPPLPGAQDTLVDLGTGVYHARVWDQDLHCDFLSLPVPLLLDSCALITGSVASSPDQSCTTPFDDGPIALAAVIAAPSGNVASTNALGQYSLFVPPGASWLTHEPYDIWTGNLCGNNTQAVLPMAGAQDVVDFVDTVHVPVNDLAIPLIYGSALVIGNTGSITFVVSNQGELPAAAVLRVPLPPFATAQTAGDPEYLGLNGDTLVYDLGILQPGEVRDKSITVDILLDVDLIGTPMWASAHVVPMVDETDLADNDRMISFTILGAYDPNDKQVSPLGELYTDHTPVTEREFTYTVRFQNTGNYYATRVLVKDSLSPLLDPTTVRILHASHNVQAFVYQGMLYLDHQGIMLPDSASDPEGSQGQVMFSVHANPWASFGDEIANTANIYFDQNPPIITNTVRNVYELSTAVDTPAPEGSLTLHLLAAGTYGYSLQRSGAVRSLCIVDGHGAVVRTLPRSPTGSFAAQDLAAGVYSLVAFTETGRYVARFAPVH